MYNLKCGSDLGEPATSTKRDPVMSGDYVGMPGLSSSLSTNRANNGGVVSTLLSITPLSLASPCVHGEDVKSGSSGALKPDKLGFSRNDAGIGDSERIITRE